MEAFLVSTCAVALAEMGDRTQLLVLLLAARFHKPLHIILGILAATLLNHGTVGYLSITLRSLFDGELLRWLMSLSFIGMGVWMLGVDPQTEKPKFSGKYGAFLTTLVSFFLVEIGDKAQIAAILMAAKFNNLILVILGSLAGMMLANVPVVLVGNYATHKISIEWIRMLASGVFILLGIISFFE
jgi:Ca2+/H+ antiporter, TMEM165/GDT1 family